MLPWTPASTYNSSITAELTPDHGYGSANSEMSSPAGVVVNSGGAGRQTMAGVRKRAPNA